MENSSFPQLLCAVLPEDAPDLRPFPLLPAYLAYQAGDGPRLYRNGPPGAIYGGVLMADDSRLRQIGPPTLFCRQAVRECRARGATGFCANWCQPPAEALTGLTAALDAALSNQGLELWVTEPYGSCCSHAKVLISSALSGGTLKLRLTEAMEQLGGDRVALAVERMAADFTLPAKTGQSKPLSPGELRALRDRVHPTIYYASEFCAYYFTYSQENQVHFVLFDTGASIRKKLLLAKQLGISSAMVAWEEIKDCTGELFQPPAKPQQRNRQRR